MQTSDKSRPRKSPTQARSRATYDAVLTASAHILEEEGLSGFNTNAVAERAGISIGSLYQYFPGKDAILSALIERRVTAFAEAVAEFAKAASGACLADDLRLLLTQSIAWHNNAGALSRLLDSEERRLQDCLDLEPAYRMFQSSLVSLLERHGAGREAGLDRAANDIALMVKALMESEGDKNEPDWPAVTERAIGAVLGYLTIAGPGDASRLTYSVRAA